GDGWFDKDEFEAIRKRLPIVYLDAVPVRVDADGVIQHIGMLLRTPRDGGISRALVPGRVMCQVRIRDARGRHLDKDLGPMALPRLPVTLTPFTVAEYFPTPGITPYHDPRQHAVSLAYVVPVDGDCRPQEDALDIGWFTTEEAVSPMGQAEMADGRGARVRTGLAQPRGLGAHRLRACGRRARTRHGGSRRHRRRAVHLYLRVRGPPQSSGGFGAHRAGHHRMAVPGGTGHRLGRHARVARATAPMA